MSAHVYTNYMFVNKCMQSDFVNLAWIPLPLPSQTVIFPTRTNTASGTDAKNAD